LVGQSWRQNDPRPDLLNAGFYKIGASKGNNEGLRTGPAPGPAPSGAPMIAGHDVSAMLAYSADRELRRGLVRRGRAGA